MRIVHFIDSADPRHGGPPVVVSSLAAEQARQGHQVRILSSFDSAADNLRYDQQLGGAAELTCVDRCALGARSVFQKMEAGAGERLAAALQGADILHAHTLWDPMLLRGIDHCRRHGIPVCLTPHGALNSWSLKQKKFKKQLALALWWRRALQHVSFLHVLTEDERADVEALGILRPSVVVPNGVITGGPEKSDESVDLESILPNAGTRRYILFLARLAYQKGLDILCDAFALIADRLPDVDLIVAGPDHAGYGQTIARHISDLGLNQRIHLVGPVYGSAKSVLLANAACLCQISRTEGFSMSILEALACGVPAIISTGCHFPDIETSGAGFVVPPEPQSAAQALFSLLSDPATAHSAAVAARELVERKYSLAATAAQLVRHYSTAAAA